MNKHPSTTGSFTRFAQTALITAGAWLGASTNVAQADLVVTDTGGASIIRNGEAWEIHAPDGTIISYSLFDIGRNQLVEFFQGGPGNRVLNRVDGPASVIQGALRADGTIYIVNPAGVLFTGGAVVDVAGLYAAAGQITNDDFAAGIDRFYDLSGEVIVEAGAQIGGGDLNSTQAIHLIGERVENHGILMSDGGVITMVAGDNVMLQELGGRLVVFVDGEQLTDLDRPVAGATSARMSGRARVINTGEIHNAGGRVILGAGDMTSLAFRNQGRIEAPGGEVNIVAGNGGLRNDGVISADEVLIQGAAIRHDRDATMTADVITLQANQNVSLRLGSTFGAHDAWLLADADGVDSGFVNIDISLALDGNLVAGGSDVFFRGETITTGGRQDYSGDFWIGEDTVLTGTEVAFAGRVNSKAVIGRNDRRLKVDGNAIFDGTVGDSTFGLLRSLSVTGDSEINGGLVRTTGNQTFAGAVSLGADAHLVSEADGNVRFKSTLDGAHDLFVETGGETRFQGTVGGAEALAAIETDAPGTTEVSADMTAATMSFGDAVELGASAVLTGHEAVDFAKTLTGNGHDLDVNSPETAFHGRVDEMGLLRTDANGTTTVDTNLVRGRAIDLGDTVEVTGDARFRAKEFAAFGKTLDGPGNLDIDAGELILFGGDVGGEKAFASLTLEAGDQNADSVNGIFTRGNLIRAKGDVLLNPRGKRSPHHVASIAGTGDLKIKSMQGSVFAGPNEKITSLGTLKLVAKEGSITHSDLNAFERIHVQSPDISIYEREPGLRLDENGNVSIDFGTDIIAKKSIDYSTTPTFFGPGNFAFFATQDGVGVKGPEGFRVYPMEISLDMFQQAEQTLATFSNSLILDLSIGLNGTRDDVLAAVYDTEGKVSDRVLLDPFAARSFEERLGLALRPMGNDELVAVVTGRELYLDGQPSSIRRSPVPVMTANRLRRESVLRVLDQYTAIFVRERPDPVTGEVVKEDQGEHVRTVLTWAWDQYAATDQAPTAEGFRAFVEATPDHAEALDYLDGLRGLFDEIWIMGATPYELRSSVNHVLADVRPGAMDQDLLEQVIGTDTIG